MDFIRSIAPFLVWVYLVWSLLFVLSTRHTFTNIGIIAEACNRISQYNRRTYYLTAEQYTPLQKHREVLTSESIGTVVAILLPALCLLPISEVGTISSMLLALSFWTFIVYVVIVRLAILLIDLLFARYKFDKKVVNNTKKE